MKEGNTICLVHAFVLSKITYVVPYLRWQVAEKEKLERLIRKVFKQALGLPKNMSMAKLLDLGLHNTLDESVEAHNIARFERLSKMKTGRYILEQLGIGYHTQHRKKADVPARLRDRIVVPLLPRNMHPEYHAGRRNNRV